MGTRPKHCMWYEPFFFFFGAVAAVYIAFREIAEAQLFFFSARAVCHRDGDEATEKCLVNDTDRSCYGCLKNV